MSMGGGEACAESAGSGGSAMEPDLAAMTEEEQIAYAMRMSMAESDPAAVRVL